ncbi:MAG: tRNA (adenine-N1)-methyltransferase, partial [Candidatus Dadabacteria bacterium]|nr:tRNA (adenine-N1)-methyltransferase [Candidatus Dadabacteria bacterium]
KSFLVVGEEGKSFSSHMGILDLSSALGKEWGETIVSSLGNDFVLLSPTVEKKMMKVRRATQIVYPKDAALILFKTDVKAGTRVVEAATGSGVLTIALANSVAPSGKVYTYERREQFMNNARDNVRRAGLSEYVEFNCGDAREGFKERDVDVAILDLPSPWYGIPASYEALVSGGRIASISPTYNQVERTAEVLEETGFVRIETVELIMRNYQVKTGKTRPDNRTVAHTGFLTFAFKATSDAANRESK